MIRSFSPALSVFAASLICAGQLTQACCPIAPRGSHVLNTDQGVIILWDKERQTQHFIRKANFKTDANDIGFIVPSPSRPQLDESGDAAFETLADITAPKDDGGGFYFPLGCSAMPRAGNAGVTIIERKRVAGYDATVLTARSGEALNAWLEANGYPYSPALAEWARPYLGGNWHFTALKLVKGEERKFDPEMGASSLRISFKTDKPLFPYREPDSAAASAALNNSYRILRIYFIAETQYEGKINGRNWSANTLWSGDITKSRDELLRQLGLGESHGPKTWWLTELVDRWPYEKAAGDVYFSPVKEVRIIDRDGKNKVYRVDASLLLLVGFGLMLKFRK